MEKTLISPLGLAPGVVTGAYYALRDQGYGDMDEVITVSTTSDLTRLCELQIEAELERARQELNVTVQYRKGLNIDNDEVRNSSDVYKFRRVILDLLNKYDQHQVYLSLTGGRKSMVAAAAMAALLHNPYRIFYVYVDEEIERDGHISLLLKKPSDKRRFYLKPPPGKIGIVEIPFLSLGERGINLTQWQARIFEFAVGAYLSTRLEPPFTQIRYKFYPDYLHGEGLGEVDVLATRQVDDGAEILLCECKMQEREPVRTEWITKLERKRQKVIEQMSPEHPDRVKGWIVTIAEIAEDLVAAAQHGIELYHAQLPRNWQERADWEIEGLTPLLAE